MKFSIVYLMIPLISALIGWITNFIAVKMIFRPHAPVSVFGIVFWGLIPKRKSALAKKIGETVEHELISHQDIHTVVNTPAFHEEILRSVMLAIDRFIEQKLGSSPIVSLILSNEATGVIKEMIKNELRGMLPGFMEDIFEKVEHRLDFKEIVQKKIEQFDMIKLENIVYKIAAKELHAIEILGGVLGFIVGLIQVGILILGNNYSLL